jgi:hypothetical protein
MLMAHDDGAGVRVDSADAIGGRVASIAHDADALETFYRAHVDAVQRFVARRVDDPFVAADLTADVFLAAIDSAHTYRSSRGEPLAWLYGVARSMPLGRSVAAGMPAVVQYIPPGKACKHPTFTPAPAGTRTPMGAGMSGSVSQSGDHRACFTIDKRAVQPDRTLVIQTQQGAAPANMPTGPSSIGIAWAKGSVRPCELVDAPAGSMLPPPGPTPPTTGREKPSLNTETGHRQGLDATPPAAGTYRAAPGDPGHAPARKSSRRIVGPAWPSS